ncbi:Pol polyprotein [Elysia marginata]|uniref:Pol polyprotein n=1 Tax=Elysia marginata TaxID=1093978 RepID=A0AAV4HDL7_9GAST|nr:Pol polyprotein [Elysia marginata]
MGKEADKIFTQFLDIEDGVTTDKHGEAENKFNKVLKLFDDYFVPKRNVIYERAKFHCTIQKPTQKVESFVIELHQFAEHCLFQSTSVRDESMRDQLVFGLKDKELTRKLQLESDLPLQKAVDMARNFETIDSQVSSQSKMNLYAVNKSHHRFDRFRPTNSQSHDQKQRNNPRPVPRGGRSTTASNYKTTSSRPDNTRQFNRGNRTHTRFDPCPAM